ncbi:MAG: adenylate/guanylate cyclase domain-containing protein [bacterium]
MKIKTKIFIQLITVMFIIMGLVGAYYYLHCKSAIKELLRSQLMNTAASCALFFNGKDFEKIHTTSDEQRPEYKSIQELLKKIAAANKDISVAYTMRLMKEKVVFAVDVPYENREGVVTYAHPGEIYPDVSRELLEGFVRPSADQEPYEDEWGYFLSGYAPIYNENGQPSVMLGIDMTVDHIKSKIRHLKIAGLISILLSIILSFFLAFFLTSNIVDPIKKVSHAVTALSSGDFNCYLSINRNDEIGELQNSFNKMLNNLKEAAVIKGIFGKYINPGIIEQLRNGALELGGRGVEVTILFVDIKGFVKLSELYSPIMLVYLLNRFFTSVVNSVEKYGGIVDKFMGDAAMIIFGNPIEDKEHASHAVAAAVAIDTAIKKLNDELRREGSPEISVGIGIDSGNVIAGNIGSNDRMEYTVIGNAVNLACRLSAKAKELNKMAAISENTANRLDSSSPYTLTEAGQVEIKGMAKTITIFVI